MPKCTLSKNKSYKVQTILFNPSEKNYKLILSEKHPGCESGIFSSKKIELKVVSQIKEPMLQFNKKDNLPELILNNLSLINQVNSNSIPSHIGLENTLEIPPPTLSHENSVGNFSFLYVILGLVAAVFLIRFVIKKLNTPKNIDLNKYHSNHTHTLNGPNNPNTLNNQNPPPSTQGLGKVGNFLTGLAGGALGYMAGRAIYDEFKSHDTDQSQSKNEDSTFSSDDGALDSNHDNNTTNGEDFDSFSSD